MKTQCTELFLDKYPRWEIEVPHQSIILHEMFLHATKQGQKEAERFIQWGHQHSLPRPNPRGRPTCHETCGIPDFPQRDQISLSHCIYLLRRLPGPLPCGPQQRKEAIWDILSSLRNRLHRWVYPIAAEEDAQGAVTKSWSRPRRREDLHEEAFQEARAAHQRVH